MSRAVGFFAGYIDELQSEIAKEIQHLKLNLSWLTNKTLTTEVLTISMTKKCNLNCTYCWDHDQRENLLELKTEEVKKLLVSARRLGVRSFNPFGGEPFIRKDTIEILRFAYEIGFKQVTVTTNGTLLSAEKIREIVESVPVGAKMGVLVSLDGATAAENDFIRSPGSFNKTTLAIRNFRMVRDELKRDVGVVVNTVVSRNNFKSMRKHIDVCRELGADTIHFLTPIMNGGVVADDMAARGLFILPSEFEHLDQSIDDVIQVAQSTDFILNNVESLRNFKNFFRRQFAEHQHLIIAT